MIDKVIEMIEQYKMLAPCDGVVVGLSGGPDSTCLLHVLHTVADRYGIKLYAAHLNHRIRAGEADRDEEFSRSFAESLDVPFYSRSIDVNGFAAENGLSSEEAGRLLRYQLFESVAELHGATKIALAHNRNDQTETMVMRLFRGTGISGLVGIRPVRDNRFIRPILNCSREEIEAYCERNALNPVIDSTNAQGIYTRNRIRLEVLPYIRQHFNPNIDESFYKLSSILRDEDDYMKELANQQLERLASLSGAEGYAPGMQIPLIKFVEIPIAVQRRILRRMIELIRGDLNGIESKHIDEILAFTKNAATGKRIMLPAGLECAVEYGTFCIRIATDVIDQDYCVQLKIPGSTVISLPSAESWTITTEIFELNNKNLIDKQFVKYFDYDKIGDVLYFRNRRDGDHISPKGMSGTKKLKQLFIDKKIPKNTRASVPLLAASDGEAGGEIYWILNMRDSKNNKPDDQTTKVLEIRITRGEYYE